MKVFDGKGLSVGGLIVALGIATVFGAVSSVVGAPLFTFFDDFETPAVTGANPQPDPADWQTNGHPSYVRLNDNVGTPGNQAVQTYSNGWLTTTAANLPNALTANTA